jgi:uncharacterized protein (TIGR04255 family)
MLAASENLCQPLALPSVVQLECKFKHERGDKVTMPAADQGRRFLLDDSPLELAVFEVRFPAHTDQVTVEEGLEIRDSIAALVGVGFPAVDPAQSHEVMLTLGPDGATQQGTSIEGVQIGDPERGHVISVFPGQLAVQVQVYGRWSVTLKPLISAALTALDRAQSPPAVTRVGLRYVNRFRNHLARDPQFWGDRIEPSLAGPIVAGPFASQVSRTQHQIELELGGDLGSTIRHGLLPEPAPRGTYSYLLDIDVYVSRTEPFDSSAVLDTAELLNRSAAEVFRRTMRPEFAVELGMHDVPEGDVTP